MSLFLVQKCIDILHLTNTGRKTKLTTNELTKSLIIHLYHRFWEVLFSDKLIELHMYKDKTNVFYWFETFSNGEKNKQIIEYIRVPKN